MTEKVPRNSHESENIPDPEFDMATSMLQQMKVANETKVTSTTSHTEKKSATKNIENLSTMLELLGAIDRAVQKPGNTKTWREYLDTMATDSDWWGKQMEKAKKQGDKAIDKVIHQQTVITEFYDMLSSDRLQNYFSSKHAHASPKAKQPAISPSESLDAQKEALLTECYQKGRATIYTSLERELALKRGLSDGYQTVGDQRNPNQYDYHLFKNAQYDFLLHPPICDVLKKQELTSAVTISPATEFVRVYEDAPQPKSFFEKLFKGTNPEPKFIGNKDEPILLKRYTENPNDNRQAYRITYIVQDTNSKRYLTPEKNRGGNLFIGTIFLPKELAQKMFSEIQQNPHILRNIFKRFDPELMQKYEELMPLEDKMFILPEGKSADAYQEQTKDIKPEYIKNI